MPRWFSSASSPSSSPDATASAKESAAPAPPPAEQLDKLRKRVAEIAPTAFSLLVASQEPGLKGDDFDDATLTRWLVAEVGDVEKAAKRLAAHAEWRSAILPAGWTPDKEAAIAKELAAGKTWVSPKPDAKGRSYLFSPSSRHLRATRGCLLASKLSLLYAMDCAARQADSAPGGDGRVVSVIDARGVGLANLDPGVSKLVVEIAQEHFPERSLTTYIYGAPAAFAAIVQLLLPLVSPSSRGKIKFVRAGADWSATAGDVVDLAALPKSLGGTGPDAVPVAVAARSVGMMTGTPAPAVDVPWGVEGTEKEEGAASEEKARPAGVIDVSASAAATQ